MSQVKQEDDLLYLLKQYDIGTYEHSLRVAKLMKRFGFYLKLDKDKISLLYELGKYHDIGKLYLAKDILTKKGKLNDDEYQNVLSHTCYGYELLQDKGYPVELLLGVLYHHENYNGTGYPFELRNDEIPIVAHLLRIVDSYDAMTNTRSYQKTQSKTYALSQLLSFKGVCYHPQYVDKFNDMMESEY